MAMAVSLLVDSSALVRLLVRPPALGCQTKITPAPAALRIVMPVNTGIHLGICSTAGRWIPACAGMAEKGGNTHD